MCGRWFFVISLLFVLSAASCSNRAPYEGRSVAELERMLRDRDPAVQAQGAHGLGLHGREAAEAVPALADALKSDHLQVRQKAAMAIGKVGPDARQAVPALIKSLEDEAWTVRRNAAIALGQIGPHARA